MVTSATNAAATKNDQPGARKIGILTFHRAYNYGAVLQAYAMKSLFSQYGCAEIIDYWPKYHRDQYATLETKFLQKKITFAKRLKYLKSSLKKIFFARHLKAKYKKFQSFIDEYLTAGIGTPFSDGSCIPQNYSIYVYGSDQIWRAFDFMDGPAKEPDRYYLGLGTPPEKKRIAYAASAGELDPTVFNSGSILALLNTFKAIGVREKDLYLHLSKIIENSVAHVQDPTFLIPREEWIKLSKKGNQIDKNTERYIFLYNLNRTNKPYEIAEALSVKLSMQVVETKGSVTIADALNPGSIDATGPLEFLNLIRKADFVVASSFHGVVFSIIFEKQFYACGMENISSRVTSLLTSLGLEDRFIKDVSGLAVENKIDYNKVNRKITQLIAESKVFIDSAMNN